MSPMDESELRDRLRSADAGPGQRPDALSTRVISRGRAVRQRRAAVATVAVAVLAVAGIGLTQALQLGNRDAVPAEPAATTTQVPTQTPTVTSGPSGLPAATPESTAPDPAAASTSAPPPDGEPPWANLSALPANYGDTGAAKLPGELTGGTWIAADARVGCDADFSLPALAELGGGRSAHLDPEGESWESQSVLVFRSEAAAQEFMAQLRRQVADCPSPTEGTRPDAASPELRTAVALHDDTTQADAFTFSSWSEGRMDAADDWGPYPGGLFSYWAREGATVMRVEWGGEFVGDIVETQPAEHETMRSIALGALAKS